MECAFGEKERAPRLCVCVEGGLCVNFVYYDCPWVIGVVCTCVVSGVWCAMRDVWCASSSGFPLLRSNFPACGFLFIHFKIKN